MLRRISLNNNSGFLAAVIPQLVSQFSLKSTSSSTTKSVASKKSATNAPSKRQQRQNTTSKQAQQQDQNDEMSHLQSALKELRAKHKKAVSQLSVAAGETDENSDDLGPESKQLMLKHRQGQEQAQQEHELPPEMLLVQLCDHMQHDQGVKRHAITITFGSDGFRLSAMCRDVRKDLKNLLASTYWQMHQTQERSAFFVCTRISHGTADLLITSMTQRVLAHVERFGYALASSNVTLSPDVQHTSVRMLYQYFVFRRKPLHELLGSNEDDGSDEDDVVDFSPPSSSSSSNKKRKYLSLDLPPRVANSATADDEDAEDEEENEGGDEDEAVDNFDEEHEKGRPEFRNFEAPKVGPQEPTPPAKKVPQSQVVKRIWDDDEK